MNSPEGSNKRLSFFRALIRDTPAFREAPTTVQIHEDATRLNRFGKEFIAALGHLPVEIIPAATGSSDIAEQVKVYEETTETQQTPPPEASL